MASRRGDGSEGTGQRACVHEMFEEHAARTPEAIALTFEGVALSYGALNQRANQLAHHLRRQGVGPEVLVGLCVERSLEMIVGLLGILKAGGAHVPLDPSYPSERLAFMLEDAAAPVLVTQRSLVATLPAYAGHVLCLDADGPLLDAQPTENLGETARGDQLAYVIYTSGSTGKPKGVMVEHEGVCNLARAQASLFSVGPESRILQFASLSFDASIWEIVMALATGARLTLTSRAASMPGPSLLQTLREQRITHVTLPPSALAVTPVAALPALRHLIVAGEVCPPSLAQRWSQGRSFTNAYGPTECTVCATTERFEEGASRLPIGRPLPGVEVFVLDEFLRPTPAGVPGELHVGGIGLARGYLRQPALTQARFIAHPFSDVPGARLYKTGDLARLLPDGRLEFLGRLDAQVKLRGFRIELGEIEAALHRHPEVRDATVRVREDQPGDPRLVAYVVPQPVQGAPAASPSSAVAGTLDGGALRAFLCRSLPEFMVPAAFVALEALPLSPSGKVDAESLPAPDWAALSRSEGAAGLVAPRDATEETLASLWSEVLGVASIGVHDSFLDLGGHSLTAIQLLSRVRERFGEHISLKSLFENPTVAGLSSHITAHRAAHGDLAPQGQGVALVRAPREARMPVSFAQERVHFIEQMSPEGTAYQAQSKVRFEGRLDVAALVRALGEMVRRHEIYRTTFPTVDGRLVQVIHPAPAIEVPIVDLRGLSSEARGAEVERLVGAEARGVFHLDRLPLVRWSLLRLGDDEHLLTHVEHHMVHDGWSAALFLRELLVVYQAYVRGEPSPLPEPALQFVDYASWQRRWVSSPAAQAQLAYWKEQLSGSPPLLALPLDRPRPPEQRFQGRQLRVELSGALSEGLRALCRREQSTLFMTMLAAFLILLRRYSGQDDLCVGSAVANRRSREVEGLIGMIVNNLVLRTQIDGDPTFQELLAQVRQVTLDAYAHEDLPFDKVVEALKPARDLSYNPLFQAMFSFHDAPLPSLRLPGLSIDMEVALGNGSAKFDLDVVAIPHAEQRLANRDEASTPGISVIWEYNSDIFEPETIARMEAQYRNLLGGIVANPSARLSELPFLTEAQQRWIDDWNATENDFPAERCAHEIFEQQVARTPEAVAVVVEGRSWTYRTLNARANQLARHLRGLGVGPERLVGLCVERSLEMVVGLLGVLKAGGAYVPIDPAYPDERVASVLADAEITVLLTQASLRGRFEAHPVTAVSLDADWATIGARDESDLPGAARPHHLAYVIYTSGSTGTPKGVMIEHRALMNFATTAAEWYGVTRQDRILQFASISFDTAVEEIFPCLTRGATLLLRTEAMLHSSDDFWSTCRAWGATVLNFPTAFWHQLTAELGPRDPRVPPTVRLVIVGGEEAQLEKVRRFHEAVAHLSPPPQLFNGYGPTEATVTATLQHCDDPEPELVPIGRPLGNTQIYLLDRHHQLVPVGAPGELHIGGVGLSRGYWRRPELTAERFIRNPLLAPKSERLYKTGDLARLRADGRLEYLGRLDSQVKIRGFRIELGEIEAALSGHPGVQQAFLTVREEGTGNKRLVAYVVPREPPLDVEAVRQFIAGKLPSYMVPTAFVLVEALPLTTSGKVDVRALPDPATSRALAGASQEAPRTPTEVTLARIWSEVLRVPEVRVDDNFFELGGDSILSIQVVSRARRVGLEITPKLLFQHQTVGRLAAELDATKAGDATRPGAHAVEAAQGEVTGAVPLTPIQRWFFEQDLSEPHHFNQSALLVTPAGLRAEPLEQAFGHLLRHHDALRLRYTPSPDGFVQVNAPVDDALAAVPPERRAFVVVDLSHLPASEQEAAMLRAEEDFQRRLDLARGPIARLAFFSRGEGQPGWLLFVVHHLAVDGISWRILLEDLGTAYEQLVRGEVVRLPAKTTSFQAWARRLEAHAQSDAVASELSFWNRPAGEDRPLPRDVGSGLGLDTMATAASVTASLTEEETRALLQDVPSVYHTQINDVLLTALVQAIARWTGSPSLRVDLEGHGREDLFDADLSRTVGWFTTMFPVRLALPVTGEGRGEAGVGEALKSVKEQLRKLPGRGIGHGLLRYLRRDEAVRSALRAHPAAEVSFNYLGQFDQVLSASSVLGTASVWKLAQSPRGKRSHRLAVGAVIRGGKLDTVWEYGEKVLERATVERLSSGYVEALRALIAHCKAPEAGGHTPSDFSASKLDQRQLDKLLGKVKRAKAK
ncbi:glycine adenylase [Chondromyces crocatus]|uniref:Glycine adenylase n=2 Tax=Chondromyces crocatus TaxID=52 RepID=A0A0K1EP84_CHOCO|nr:glycine adenylase [Chondromyces crocatus]